ncbi:MULTISPECIES: hypothetical protein [Rothia]|uniref:hypothetical protein n=1 Tax=Rothia TaxID=32207 RepID=UPI000A4A6BC5|nr:MULTISPECIES: hypothetical protein [Rothia]
MSDVISQESFDELALYFNRGGHLLTRMRAASPPNAPASSAPTGSMHSGSTRTAPG